MKINVEVDCTPDEARQFFGLPDVKPMQAALLQKIEAQMTEAVDRFSPDALLSAWLSMAPAGADGFRTLIESMFKKRPGT